MLSKLEESELEPPTSQEDECVICISSRATMQTMPCGHQVSDLYQRFKGNFFFLEFSLRNHPQNTWKMGLNMFSNKNTKLSIKILSFR